MTAPVRWVPGYGTNGFHDHPLPVVLDLLQEHGYGAVALTLGFPHLDPFADDWRATAEALAADLDRRGLRVVVETGTRFLLDRHVKHRPTLVDRQADLRMAYLRRAIEIAAVLRADCVSLWSGVLPADVSAAEAWTLLRDRVAALLPFATDHQVVLSVEPEPGMVVETVADALRLHAELGSPENLGITVDLGHCVAVEPEGVVGALRAAGPLLRNIQVDDMLPGVHEHLELGTGDLDLGAALATLAELDYRGIAAIELPRHSHDAPRLARTSMEAMMNAAAPTTHPWLAEALATLESNTSRITRFFAEAGRKVGRAALDAADAHSPTQDDVARAALVAAVAAHHPAAADEILRTLYVQGDDAERRGVLAGLNLLADQGVEGPHTGVGVELVNDALRTNDPRLVATAMGRFAERALDQHGWRHGVLKLIFMGVPLRVVSGLGDRQDTELAEMAGRFAAERAAAGRTVPADLALLTDFAAATEGAASAPAAPPSNGATADTGSED